MLLGQLSGWPPAVRDVNGTLFAGVGVIRSCVFMPASPRLAAHLELTIQIQDRILKTIYWHTSESILRRIAATLRERSGLTVESAGALELAGFHED